MFFYFVSLSERERENERERERVKEREKVGEKERERERENERERGSEREREREWERKREQTDKQTDMYSSFICTALKTERVIICCITSHMVNSFSFFSSLIYFIGGNHQKKNKLLRNEKKIRNIKCVFDNGKGMDNS